MRLSHLSGRNIAFYVFVVISVIVLLFGVRLLPFPFDKGRTTQAVVQATATPTPAGENAIVRENARQGTRDWQIPSGSSASNQIQAYASATSVLPGQSLIFYVSTLKAGTPYSLAIYRLGWYGGLGGRLMALQANQRGHVQGYYDQAHHQLVDCARCHVDVQTGLVEANWQPSYLLKVPADWTNGIYLAKLTDGGGWQTYVPFDVRSTAATLYLAVTPDTTHAAYNVWGGYSLYRAYSTVGAGKLGQGVKVSFDRPYADHFGSSQVLFGEADAIHWLERQGYDLSYMSDVDVQRDPTQLLQHHAYLSLGHDEYWTKEMRSAVENARNYGVGLAFLGADAVYWQMRFEPDSAGVPNRTIVCYKVDSGFNDLARDPLYGKDNTRVTAPWSNPLLGRPENALVGIMYSSNSNIQERQGYPWQVNPQAHSSLLDGTGLQVGQAYGCDVVGNEWDRAFSNGATPAGLQVLGISSTVDTSNHPDISETTYYIAPSGAMVFATGSIYWTLALDSYRFAEDPLCVGQSPVVPGMQRLLANVMAALVTNHPL
jgi:hypothetical protein